MTLPRRQGPLVAGNALTTREPRQPLRGPRGSSTSGLASGSGERLAAAAALLD